MNKTKIEWTDSTWNPVWGCLNNCEYCYARKMAWRFAGDIGWKEASVRWDKGGTDYKPGDWIDPKRHELIWRLKSFKPTWLESNFQRKFPKKPARIYVNSMSEIKYWDETWMERVLNKIREYPQHTFQFLTKFPEVYNRYIFPQNCWLGVTVTRQKDLEKLIMNESVMLKFDTIANKIFLSIEPILEPIRLYPTGFDWIIVGAMSGPGSKKHQPEPEWIRDIADYSHKYQISLFMKDSIKPYWNGELITEFPGGGK